MKIRSQISTGQFEYSRIELDLSNGDTPEKSALKAKELDVAHRAAFQEKPESTLPEKDFTDLIYKTLHSTKDMDVEQWELCNPAQKTFLKLLHNAMNRKKPETKIAGVDFKKNLDALDDLTNMTK